MLPLLGGVYDISVGRDQGKLVFDSVDCTGTTYTAAVPLAALTVDFPGLRSVHTGVHVADDSRVVKANWKNDGVTIPVLAGVFDVLVDHAVDEVFDRVDCSAGPCAVTVIGDAQVTRADGDSGAPIAGQRIDAYEKTDDGRLQRRVQGTTDPAGRIHFTLPGLGDGATYVLKTWNPFGNGKRYYSPLLTDTGPFRFEITIDTDCPLDTTPPTLALLAPADGATVPVSGFTLHGTTDDDNALAKLTVTVEHPPGHDYQPVGLFGGV